MRAKQNKSKTALKKAKKRSGRPAAKIVIKNSEPPFTTPYDTVYHEGGNVGIGQQSTFPLDGQRHIEGLVGTYCLGL